MRLFLLFIFIITIEFNLSSQDNHYWSQMGGITAGLLGGSAIAGLKDNSSLYYNAATMAFVNNPSISVGASAYSLRLTNIDNAFGENKNQFTNQFSVNPELIGGLLFSKKNEQFRFGYAVSTRFLHQNSLTYQTTRTLDSGETFIGDFDIYNKIQETWLNSANSYKIDDHMAFGYSLIIAFRSQFYDNYISAKVIPQNDSEAIRRIDSRINYNYWNVKALLKLSYAVDYENYRLGWNMTLPSLNLFGRAFSKRELSLVNNDTTKNVFPSNVIISGNDERISTVHKYPLSMGLGASFKLKNNDWIHVSTEMFLPIKEYTIFESSTEPTYFPTSTFDSLQSYVGPLDDFMRLTSESKFIANISVGYENFISNAFGILGGFRTDFNNSIPKEYEIAKMTPYQSSWDIYYLSMGVWGIIKRQKVTTGLEFGFSPTTNIEQRVNFDGNSNPNYPLVGATNKSAQANQLIIRLFLGVEINYSNKQGAK